MNTKCPEPMESQIYLATSFNMSIVFTKGQNIQWWIDSALEKGSTITIEPVSNIVAA